MRKECKIESHCNVADCLTKALPRDSVEMARHYMFGVHNVRV